MRGEEERRGVLTSVSSFPSIRHDRVIAELSGLVVGGFEDGHAAHGGFGGGDDREVLAR